MTLTFCCKMVPARLGVERACLQAEDRHVGLPRCVMCDVCIGYGQLQQRLSNISGNCLFPSRYDPMNTAGLILRELPKKFGDVHNLTCRTQLVNSGGLGRLAAWHLPSGSVGPASWRAATSCCSRSNDLPR